VGLFPDFGEDVAYRQVPNNIAYPPVVPATEERKVRHRPHRDVEKRTRQPPDCRPHGRHTTAVDSVKALFDKGPSSRGPTVPPILVIDDRGGRPRGRQEVRHDIVVDVLLGTQMSARPLGLPVDRHGGGGVGSGTERHPASRGGKSGDIRKPHPRLGYQSNSGRGENPVAPSGVVPPE